MLILNGKQFAPSKRACVESLFKGPETASGTYRFNASGILLYNLAGERIGGINRHGVMYRSTRVDGKLWHQPATPDAIGAYESYRQMRADSDTAIDKWRAEVL